MSHSRLACLLIGAAVAAFAVPAMAQEQSTLPLGGQVLLTPDRVVYANPPMRGGYQSRATGVVYDNTSNVFGNGTGGTILGQTDQILEDISFVGSPWALPYSGGDRIITGFTFGVAPLNPLPTDPAGTTQTTDNDNVALVFWNPADVSFNGFGGTGTPMINAGATPLGTAVVDVAGLDLGFIWQLTLTGQNIPVPADANGVYVQVVWLNAAAGTPTDFTNLNGFLSEACPSTSLRTLAFGSNSLAGPGGNPATVGSTLLDYGRDLQTTACCDNVGAFIGRPITDAPACQEHRQIQITPTGGTATQGGFQISLQGDIQAAAPANTDLGALSDSPAPVSDSVDASSVKWYSFTLNGDATDAALQFLDLDSEGSAADVSFAIFDSSGTLIDTDDNSGSGANAQMSFGVGRRAAVGDGQQYDGRNGELIAGTYFVAVAPGGSTFGSGFTANASANPAGAFTLNFQTNTNGTPLAPSVAPLINGIDYDALIGVPVDPDFPGGDFRQGATHDTGTRGVVWNRFTLQSPIDAAHFLDLDWATLSTASADGVAYIFDSNGNIVYFSDDEGPAALPQFSIGAGGARFYGADGPFDGNTPAGASAGLPAGTYYLAELLFDANDSDLSFLPTDHRWHVRSTSGSNLTLTAVLVAGQGSTGPACDPDLNQDGNADQGDIDYLINVIAGGENPTGIDPDFNQDGNADQGDIDALLNVVAGGNCP